MFAWTAGIRRDQWKTLAAAQLGWTLDAMDVMLYAFALTQIRTEFDLSSGGAGALASVTLLASAAGGILFGFLADRYGRARALTWSILVYSVATAATASSASIPQLVLWRTLVGIGLGGEWSAGSVLVAETWPAEHRAKAIGLMQSGWAVGYVMAAGLAAWILPLWGWRVLFLAGILPALLATLVRTSVPEPESWRAATDGGAPQVSLWPVLRPPLLGRTVAATLVAMSVLFAYWGLFTWMPTFLAAPVERGGAGLGLVKSSAWLVPMQIGAFLGYTTFGFLADRFGRRPTFFVFVLGAAAVVPVFGFVRAPWLLLALGPLVGYFGHGYFSVFGAMLAELFPSGIRATAQGFCYNAGRAVSAAAPFTLGVLADRHGLGAALATTSLFFLLAALLIRFLPETRGQALA